MAQEQSRRASLEAGRRGCRHDQPEKGDPNPPPYAFHRWSVGKYRQIN
jgi:hypothetical protein